MPILPFFSKNLSGVKKKVQKVKSYFSKNKPYSNKPRPTKTNSQKLKKYKVYIPPKP